MPNGDPRVRYVYPYLTLMIDFFLAYLQVLSAILKTNVICDVAVTSTCDVLYNQCVEQHVDHRVR